MKTNQSSCQDIPSCEIRIDKDGVWYFRGAEMYRKEIVNLFYQGLRRDGSGRYIIELGDDRCYLEVEDTPFIVKSIYSTGSREAGDEVILLVICDDTIEKLEPSTLRIGKDNVLYCDIRSGEFEARFSRPSYYQLADYFEYDEEKERYVLILNGTAYSINGVSVQGS